MSYLVINLRIIIFAFSMIFVVNGLAIGSTYINFDDMTATSQDEVPGSGDGWTYSSPKTNPSEYISTSGWISTQKYPTDSNIFDFFTYYRNGYNNAHMGFETYGFLEIDNSNSIIGNSLKIKITGGRNSNGQWGIPLYCKEDYLSLTGSGQNPVSSGSKVGHPYIYFMNNSLSSSTVPFYQAKNSNRLSLYIKLPSEIGNGSGGSGRPPEKTINIGPYNNIGGHWYHNFYNQGGGWTHVIVDGHPQHNNAFGSANDYPYPSYSIRDMGTDYFDSMYRWYVTFWPYEGIATPNYNIWVDEIEFQYDPEPQNNETISSPAITYLEDNKSFELSFNDKYKNNQYSYSTYELRYSFSQITNSNWSQATPVHIESDPRYGISARSDGKFAKWWPYYQAVWTTFRLANSTDEAKLTAGAKIYFAIKDISQVNGNGKSAVQNCGIGNWGTCGRDYANQGSSFDYSGDQSVLNLIKRIDFTIPGNSGFQAHGSEVPTNLRIVTIP